MVRPLGFVGLAAVLFALSMGCSSSEEATNSGSTTTGAGGGGVGGSGGGGGQQSAIKPVATKLAAGVSHTCAVVSGAASCWGYNNQGQLGIGKIADEVTAKPTLVKGLEGGVQQIAAGGAQTCALMDNGSVKCWGSNLWGQVGDGTGVTRGQPVDVVGLSSGVVAIAVGGSHACALLSTGGVSCWGSNTQGELGDGTTKDHPVPTPVKGLSSGVASIVADSSRTCAVLADGSMKCWGTRILVGDGTTDDHHEPTLIQQLPGPIGAAVSAGNHTCVLPESGGALCWGDNDAGELGDGTQAYKLAPTTVAALPPQLSMIATGVSHTCALTGDGSVKCWGSNTVGQLGNGVDSIIEKTAVATISLPKNIDALVAGDNHSCVMLDSSKVLCWGSNQFLQLGNTLGNEGRTPVEVMW